MQMDTATLKMLEAVATMPLDQRRKRYGVLSRKVVSLEILSRDELNELITLRNLLQKDAVKQREPGDHWVSL